MEIKSPFKSRDTNPCEVNILNFYLRPHAQTERGKPCTNTLPSTQDTFTKYRNKWQCVMWISAILFVGSLVDYLLNAFIVMHNSSTRKCYNLWTVSSWKQCFQNFWLKDFLMLTTMFWTPSVFVESPRASTTWYNVNQDILK